ncbi:hypothetical protein DL95DRAFT_437278 [Leptodontidium sp. 2 PMI_412]|nr:hypothetical protein DL95DRAFT_437278 [Leptodontidium sp. 2 PMI_412]
MLTDKIPLSGPETNEPEDYLFSSLASSIIYLSPSHGSAELTLADPRDEGSKKLFSHFLWNAGVQLAEFIEEGRSILGADGEVAGREAWSVKGKRVFMAGLEGAEQVVISDYPAQEVLKNISANVERNITCHEHGNLLKSIEWFLSDGEGRAWVVAGFHTGREKMKRFSEEGALKEARLEIDRIWERSAEGFEREWVEDRGVEVVTERKRRLVVGILKKRVS